MLLENTLLLVIGSVLTLIALGMTALIGLEVVHLFRALRGASPDDLTVSARSAKTKRKLKQAYKDRETVERLIEHFKPEDTPGGENS